jgi:hypothetical protein
MAGVEGLAIFHARDREVRRERCQDQPAIRRQQRRHQVEHRVVVAPQQAKRTLTQGQDQVEALPVHQGRQFACVSLDEANI